MNEKQEADNWVIMQVESKQSSSTGKTGFNKKIEVKVSNANEEEMREKLRIAKLIKDEGAKGW